VHAIERVPDALTQLVRASGLAARMDRRVTLQDGHVVELE
jgi:hypothetical protein